MATMHVPPTHLMRHMPRLLNQHLTHTSLTLHIMPVQSSPLCNCSRQVHREFRKPLVLMSPKALLRHPACKSKLFEFDDIPDEEGIQARAWACMCVMRDGLCTVVLLGWRHVSSRTARGACCYSDSATLTALTALTGT